MKVTLKQKRRKKGISLYLEYYEKGIRRFEYLKIYLKVAPEGQKLSRAEQTHNKELLELAQNIQAKRQIEALRGVYGFEDRSRQESSFIEYFKQLTNQRIQSKGSYGNWRSTLCHIMEFTKTNDLKFRDVTQNWLIRFKEYLDKKARTKTDAPLSQNTKTSYFSKIKAALKTAKKEGIIRENPGEKVSGFTYEDPEKEYLTVEELKALFRTPCELELLKKAFLFGCLTGLRWSDLSRLHWKDIQYSPEHGHFIRLRQKKTKINQVLPIPAQAVEVLEPMAVKDRPIFQGLTYGTATNKLLQDWIHKSGIDKKITFHCSRHTFAVLLLSQENDIYTVKNLLGHKHLKTTETYVKPLGNINRKAVEGIPRINSID
jgi:integrase